MWLPSRYFMSSVCTKIQRDEYWREILSMLLQQTQSMDRNGNVKAFLSIKHNDVVVSFHNTTNFIFISIFHFFRYNFDETLYSIVASIVIPNGLFIISLIVLLYWHCPYCQARCRKYEEQMDFDERDDV